MPLFLPPPQNSVTDNEVQCEPVRYISLPLQVGELSPSFITAGGNALLVSHKLSLKKRIEVAKLPPQTRRPPLQEVVDANPTKLRGIGWPS
jgi:hypothetical protein